MSSISWVSPSRGEFAVYGVDKPDLSMSAFPVAVLTANAGDTLEAIHLELWNVARDTLLDSTDMAPDWPDHHRVQWVTAPTALGVDLLVDIITTEALSGITTHSARGSLAAGQTTHAIDLPAEPTLVGAVVSLSEPPPDDITAVHYARGDASHAVVGPWGKKPPAEWDTVPQSMLVRSRVARRTRGYVPVEGEGIDTVDVRWTDRTE